jgi:hypothetical protein
MLADAVQGARHTAQLITWVDDEGDPLDLTGAAITGRIQDAMSGVARDATGALAVVNGTTGAFQWAYSAADVATPGAYRVQFTATFGDGLADRTLIEEWTVLRAL